jgi:hypothetical protein
VLFDLARDLTCFPLVCQKLCPAILALIMRFEFAKSDFHRKADNRRTPPQFRMMLFLHVTPVRIKPFPSNPMTCDALSSFRVK